MEANLQPDPNATTNALLAYFIQQSFNSSSPPAFLQASLQAWEGASNVVLWTQALAYLSLGLSLLAAFGAVLGKQWLGHFKTSRYGYGTRKERGVRRQRKLQGINDWYLHHILDALPIMLQLSLLLFGISLAMNLLLEQKGLGILITVLVVFGITVYFSTFMIGLKYSDSPFQNGLTILAKPLLKYIWLRTSPVLQGLTQISQKAFRYFTISSLTIDKANDISLAESKAELSEQPLSKKLTTSDVMNREDYYSPDLLHTVLWLLKTSTDSDAIGAGVFYLSSFGNWWSMMDSETASTAFQTLSHICEVDISLGSLDTHRAVHGLMALVDLCYLSQPVSDVSRWLEWLEQHYNLFKARNPSSPGLEKKWKLSRFPPYQEWKGIGSLENKLINPTDICLERVLHSRSINHNLISTFTIQECASIWSYAIESSSKLHNKYVSDLVRHCVSLSIVGILGLQLDVLSKIWDSPGVSFSIKEMKL